MRWIKFSPEFRDESARKFFRRAAARIEKESSTEVLTKARQQFGSADDNLLRAAGLLLCDLADQGHAICVRADVQFSVVPYSNNHSADDNIRSRLQAARAHQLKAPAVREFISSVEKRRLHKGKWTSIFSLMRDGTVLAEELRRLRSGAVRSSQVIAPYVQVVTADDVCEFTGLPLIAIWRYFRHTWANPYQSVPGRSFLLLVRDAAAPFHPVIGIAALASSAVQLAVRDKWIEWDSEQIVEKLRANTNAADIQWLTAAIAQGIEEIYLDDLLDPEESPLTRKLLKLPSVEIITWLQRYSADQRELHQQHATVAEHKRFIEEVHAGDSLWKQRAETPLFRSKRAAALAVLLRARRALQNHSGVSVTPSQLMERLKTGEGRQSIQSLLRRIKAERVGIALADISVCGAIPPYAALTGGKLVAMLVAGPQAISSYARRYAVSKSIIASSVAGRPIIRAPHLVFLGTTSLYGTEPNQYTRVSIPCELMGGKSGQQVRYMMLGKTEGYGTFQFSDATVQAMSAAVSEYRGGQRVNSIFGEGVNPRLRKIRDGLDLMKLDSDQLLLHGNQRLIYGIPLAENFREYLLGRESEPRYMFSTSNGDETTRSIAEWWANRWLLRRIERDEILDQVAEHRLTYPVMHGARVRTPEGQEELGLEYEASFSDGRM